MEMFFFPYLCNNYRKALSKGPIQKPYPLSPIQMEMWEVLSLNMCLRTRVEKCQVVSLT